MNLISVFSAAIAQQTPTAAGVARAYRPFIDAVDVHHWWFLLLIPIAFLVSIGYKAVRMHELTGYVRQVLMMTVQIVVGMVLLAVAFYALVAYAQWWASR
ncbi:MAG: hypothetical protein IBJ18_13225 [Phycisphaerales bacterium]|nr:hypothetical protein [Phycisphaerales bacterium]